MFRKIFVAMGLSLIVMVVAACGAAAPPAQEIVTDEPVKATVSPTEESVTLPEAEPTSEAESVVEPTQAPTEEVVEATEEMSEAAQEEESATLPTEEAEPTAEAESTLEPTTPAEEAVAAGMTAQEAYDAFMEEALAWQSDAELDELATTIIGPLEADGTSESWSAIFWSPSAQALNSMSYISGQINATPIEMPADPGTVPDVENVILDTATIYVTAEEAGGSQYLSEGYVASASLVPYPLDDTLPTWYINYMDPETAEVIFTVIVDAHTGEVIQAIQ